jgi:hypothetical protein
LTADACAVAAAAAKLNQTAGLILFGGEHDGKRLSEVSEPCRLAGRTGEHARFSAV